MSVVPGPAQPPVGAVIAHRGASGLAPENTLASFRKAAAIGCRWVEFDCQLTRDRQIVLLHDASLARTAGDPRDVHLVDLATVQGLDAGGWFAEEFAGEPVPTLEQATAFFKGAGMGAIVEIKAGNNDPTLTAETVSAHLHSHWPNKLPAPVLCSFAPEILAACVATAPDLARGIGFWEVPEDWQDQARRFGCSALHVNHDFLDAETARAMVAAGYVVRAYTVNAPDRAAELFEWGVHSIFTDVPDRIPIPSRP